MLSGPFRIESLAYTGWGVTHDQNGKALFVDAAIPGDLVQVEITQEHARYNNTRIHELLEPSSHRVFPRCPHAASCGGCTLQHLDYQQQLNWKRSFVCDALKRIAHLDACEEKVAETLFTPSEWGYRNKIELVPVPEGKRLTLGYHARHSNAVIPVTSCLLFPESQKDLPARLSGALSYALGTDCDQLKRVAVRVSERTGDSELSLWMEPSPCSRQFLSKVIAGILPSTSLTRVLAAGEVGKRDVRRVEVLSGRGYWCELLAGLTYKVSAPSFFQVNTSAAELLVNTVVELVGEPSQTVIDLYSGVGSFTLPLAKRNHTLTAVESEKSSVRDLRRNLADNGLEAEVVGGGVEYELPRLTASDCILVDPPRRGLSSRALKTIIEADPQTLIYVSCDPATLGRDLRSFLLSGFTLASITPVDLFPQTYHVESVALLKKS